MNSVDLLVVGAGPAGMAAAITARDCGLEVLVIDDQPAPGGQIWRSVELTTRRDAILGPPYVEGRTVTEAFRASGAHYLPGAQMWQVEPGFRAFVSRDRQAQIVHAKAIILATGAQERPVPFPGWTLPGVLTVGAAHILLKNAGQIPVGPVWIAGSGLSPLAFAFVLLRAGGKIAGFLDTTPAGQWRSALPHLPGALRAPGELSKCLGLMARLRASRVTTIRGVADVEAFGTDRIEGLRYRTRNGTTTSVAAATLLVHEGFVPNVHPAMALDGAMTWNSAQDCYQPAVDRWGETSVANLYVAGDGAGIAGAKAALLRGQLAAIRVAEKGGRLTEQLVSARASAIDRQLRRELAARPFLDALFQPRPQIFSPVDQTIVCRCEEITAGEIRSLANIGCPGPNQIKAATRAGMGPCQGRQCGYTVTRILAEAQKRQPSDVGFFHVRPPLKPVTLGELASLHEPVAS